MSHGDCGSLLQEAGKSLFHVCSYRDFSLDFSFPVHCLPSSPLMPPDKLLLQLFVRESSQFPIFFSFFTKVKSSPFSCSSPIKGIMEGEAFPSSFHPVLVYLQRNRPELE